MKMQTYWETGHPVDGVGIVLEVGIENSIRYVQVVASASRSRRRRVIVTRVAGVLQKIGETRHQEFGVGLSDTCAAEVASTAGRTAGGHARWSTRNSDCVRWLGHGRCHGVVSGPSSGRGWDVVSDSHGDTALSDGGGHNAAGASRVAA